MPCSDGGWSASEQNTSLHQENKQLTDRVHLNARVACEAIRMLENYFTVSRSSHLSHELKSWWEQHKREDAARILQEREAARLEAEKQAEEQERQVEMAIAVSKLTLRERELLGIKYRGQ